MLFKSVTIESKELINSYIKRIRILTSDYSLPVLLTWFDLKEPEVAEYNDTLFLRGYLDGKRIYFPPLTSKSFAEAVDTLDEYTRSIGEPFEIILALKEQIDKLDKSKYIFTTNRDYAEYLYRSEDLINLVGKKYHSKRNHINRFKRKYNYEYRSFRKDDYNGVIEHLKKWAEDKGEDATEELKMVEYWLSNMEALDLFSDVMVVDGDIAGASIGECSNPDMGIVMYEKCDFSYDGICAAINQMFAKKRFSNVEYINRQEDMGIEGLRLAKLSYKPVRLVYRWTIKRINDV